MLIKLQEDENGGSQVFTLTCKDDNSFMFSRELESTKYYIGVKDGIAIPIREPSNAACFLYVPYK